jgi:mono/diheme cytochrome c family protein
LRSEYPCDSTRQLLSAIRIVARVWDGVGVAAVTLLGVLFLGGVSALAAEPMAGAGQRGAQSLSTQGHFADADDPAAVAAGKLLYKRSCSGCHGHKLQGQPLWQLEDQYFGRRAPAHDQTGHTWAHSDEDLFHMTKEGRFVADATDKPSYMPAFRGLLTDSEILAVLAYIKSTWPIGLRISQALLNPGNAGMPANAADADWTLPPTCTISAQRWRSTSR